MRFILFWKKGDFMTTDVKKAGALSFRTWLSIVLFGLVGQIAWVVENMYFSRFMQNEITKAPYATTLLVAFSALFATLATLIGGALSDRAGKRKAFICWGYVVWGFTIAAFSLVPMQPSAALSAADKTAYVKFKARLNEREETRTKPYFNILLEHLGKHCFHKVNKI